VIQSEWAGVVEIVLVFGVALAFGVWQLVSVRREIRRDKEKASAARRSPGDPG
jgi:hypothetical protein